MIETHVYYRILCDGCQRQLSEGIDSDCAPGDPIAFCKQEGWLVDEKSQRCVCDRCIKGADIANSIADAISKANIEKAEEAAEAAAVLVDA